MKRLHNILSFIFLGFIISVSYSCQDEESKDNDIHQKENMQGFDIQFNYTVEDNMLAFRSVSDYEAAISFLNSIDNKDFDRFESQIGFISMRTYYSKSNSYVNIPVDDDLFATLLNPDARIKIGDKVYEIDTKKEQVYVISSDVFNKNQSIGKTNTKEISTYSFDDDVLDIDNESSLKWGGNCPSFKHYHKSLLYNGYEIESVLHYMKFGIYFKLKAEINKMFTGGGGIITIINLNTDVTWKNSADEGTIHAGSSISGDGDTKNIIYTFYSGMRPLKQWSALSIDCGWWDFTPNGQQYFRHWKTGDCD